MSTHVCLCCSVFLLIWCFFGSFGCWVCRIRVSWDRGGSLHSGFKLIPLTTLFGFAWVLRVRSHHTFSGDLICRLKTSGFPVTLLFTCPLHSENNLVFGKCNWKLLQIAQAWEQNCLWKGFSKCWIIFCPSFSKRNSSESLWTGAEWLEFVSSRSSALSLQRWQHMGGCTSCRNGYFSPAAG